jgi:uncharacterized protein (UPF0548 family)
MTSSPIAPRREWFPRPHADARYLTAWRAARPTYMRGDERGDPAWRHDQHERLIGHDAGGALFTRAADRLMRYQFYPASLLEPVSDFGRAGRWAQPGDLIVQRIHALSLLGWPVLDVVTLTEISEVTDEPRRRGLAYVTTDAHLELGEWRVWVEWRGDNSVILQMDSLSKPGPRVAAWERPLARSLQRRAHRAGLALFTRAALER